MGAVPEEVRRRPLLGPQVPSRRARGGVGAGSRTVTSDPWYVRPRPKISRDVLNPEIQGA